MGRAADAAYSRQERAGRSPSRRTVEPRPATEVAMKVKTDVKAGGGLLGLTAIVIVDVDLNLFGCGYKKRC